MTSASGRPATRPSPSGRKGTRRTGPGVTSASAGKVILKQNRDGSIVLYN